MKQEEYTIEELEKLLELIWKSGDRSIDVQELYHKTQQILFDELKRD